MPDPRRRRSNVQRRSVAADSPNTVKPQRPVSTDTSPEALHDAIARRAHELYEQRGGDDGHDWDDWLQAEREFRATKVE